MKKQIKEIIWRPYPEMKPDKKRGDFLVTKKYPTGLVFIDFGAYDNDKFIIDDEFIIAFADTTNLLYEEVE